MGERGIRLFLPVDQDGNPYGTTNPMPIKIGTGTTSAVDARITDEFGVAYTSTRKLPVDIAGANITGTFNNQPAVVSTANVPAAPLGASAVFLGTWEDVKEFASIQIGIFTDAASATNGAVIEFSHNGTDVLRAVPTTIPANFAAYFHLSPEARYVRFRYTNGATAQTILRVSVIFSYVTPAEVVQPIGSTTTDANVATVVQSHLKGRVFSGASTGAWVPLGTDGTGNLLVRGTDTRTLSERMFAKAPATGYALWLDTADVTHIYLAEAPTASDGTATNFRGIRVQKDATGNPLGKVQILDGFTWNTRTAAAWQ